MRRLKFSTGTSRSRSGFNSYKEILSLNQEIIELKNRLGNVESNISEPISSTKPTPEVDQLSKSLDIVKNIGNLTISKSGSTYKKEKPLEMEEEMEMEE